MELRAFLKNQLEQSMAHVLGQYEGLEGHYDQAPTANGGCNPLWVLGHLADSEGQIIHVFARGEAHPNPSLSELFGNGSDPQADTSAYPPFEELMDICRNARLSTIELIETYSEADLAQASAMTPPNAEALFATHANCFQFACNHFWMHRAHLTDAKRSAGLYAAATA